MQKIYNDGTDQELYFKGVKSDLSGEFAGTVDGESLPGAIVQIKEYKLAFTEVLGTTVTWDALAGYWFVTIPAAYITQSGSMLVAVAGTGMKNVTIDADVTVSGILTLAAIKTQVDTAISDAGLVTKIELDTAIDALPTASEIVTAIDADVIEGTYTRKQVMRILAAVLAGTRANANDVDTFTGLDGATARVVASVSSTGRTITTLDGD